MDALSDVLRAVRLKGAIFFDVHASDPWAAETPAGQDIVGRMFPAAENLICYHAITQGTCWAAVAGEAPLLLRAGDVVGIPHGHAHVLSSTPGPRGERAGAAGDHFHGGRCAGVGRLRLWFPRVGCATVQPIAGCAAACIQSERPGG